MNCPDCGCEMCWRGVDPPVWYCLMCEAEHGIVENTKPIVFSGYKIGYKQAMSILDITEDDIEGWTIEPFTEWQYDTSRLRANWNYDPITDRKR